MAHEFHSVVKLLLARAQSHPEEFSGCYTGYGSEGPNTRWSTWLRQLQDHMTPEEKTTLNDTVREIRMTQIHHEVMQELLK